MDVRTTAHGSLLFMNSPDFNVSDLGVNINFASTNTTWKKTVLLVADGTGREISQAVCMYFSPHNTPSQLNKVTLVDCNPKTCDRWNK